MSNESQTVISLQDLAAVTGGAPRGGVTYGSPITSSPWSTQNVEINNYNTTNNNSYGQGVKAPGMSMVEFRKLNPLGPNRPLGQHGW